MASLFFLLSLQSPLERCHAMSRTKDEQLEGKTRERKRLESIKYNPSIIEH